MLIGLLPNEPLFHSSSEDEDEEKSGMTSPPAPRQPVDSSDEEPKSSDLDTDFEADDLIANLKQIQNVSRRVKPSAKAIEANEATTKRKKEKEEPVKKAPPLKLKIKLPPKPPSPPPVVARPIPPKPRARMINTSLNRKLGKQKLGGVRKKYRKPAAASKFPAPVGVRFKGGQLPAENVQPSSSTPTLPDQSQMSEKMRESLALNQAAAYSSSSSSSEESGRFISVSMLKSFKPFTSNILSFMTIVIELEDCNQHFLYNFADNEASAPMQSIPGEDYYYAKQDDKLYCVCQSPHDDVSEMIGCDAPDCPIEWFHFECMGIMVPPAGKWYCPDCTKRYKLAIY